MKSVLEFCFAAYTLISASTAFAAPASKSVAAYEGEVVLTEKDLCGKSPTELCKLEFENYEQAREVRNLLYKKHWLLVTAESITGGNFAGTLAKVHDASHGLGGGVISYAPAVKDALLSVTATTSHEVISESTAREMVDGLPKLFASTRKLQESRKEDKQVNVYIAFTGAATTWEGIKPVAYIALKIGEQPAFVKKIQLDQNRSTDKLERVLNIQNAIKAGLTLLRDELIKTN